MEPHFPVHCSCNNVLWVSQEGKRKGEIKEYNYFCNWVQSQRLLLVLWGQKLYADIFYILVSPQSQWSHHHCEWIMVWELVKLWHDLHNEQLYCTSQTDASTVFSFSFSPSAPMKTFSAQWQQANHSICHYAHFCIYKTGIIALASFKRTLRNP